MYGVFQSSSKRRVNVGTIGHVDYGKTTLSAVIRNAVRRRNKSDRKRNRADRWR